MSGGGQKKRQPFRFKHRADMMRNISVGTEIVATSHAYHPDMIGLTRVVTKVQTDGLRDRRPPDLVRRHPVQRAGGYLRGRQGLYHEPVGNADL